MEENGYRAIGATTYLCPTPTVLVGCAADGGWRSGGQGRPNLITIAWVGVCSSKPPVIGVAVRPERFSHGLIAASGEFTVNLIGEPLLHAMDLCGVKSGRDMDKFAELGLTALPADGLAAAPALREAPAYLSCKVLKTVSLGSHDLFLGEVVQVNVHDAFFREDGSIDEQAMALVAYVHGKYRALGDELGFYGYSVAGPEALERRMPAAAARKPREEPKAER